MQERYTKTRESRIIVTTRLALDRHKHLENRRLRSHPKPLRNSRNPRSARGVAGTPDRDRSKIVEFDAPAPPSKCRPRRGTSGERESRTLPGFERSGRAGGHRGFEAST